MNSSSHRRRTSGISVNSPTPANSPRKGKSVGLHIRDPLAKRSPTPEYPFENGFRRTIRQNLIKVSGEESITAVEEAIGAFVKNRLEDKGDLAKAKETLEYLNLKKGLVDAIHRRRVETLDKAITKAKNSKYAEKFYPHPMKKAENLRDELSCLDRYYHPIMLLNQRTISELRRYRSPPDVIKSTMAAAFLLLGELEENIEDWDYILHVLGIMGNGSVKLKMQTFDATLVPKGMARKAERYLESVNINSVRQASFGCAAFYMWARKAIADVKSNEDAPDLNVEPFTQQEIDEAKLLE